MLNIIQRYTVLQGWKFGRLDGNTNVASRQRLVDNFNADKSYYGMLCTTRTGKQQLHRFSSLDLLAIMFLTFSLAILGGVGLNLTGADRIILYDPDW
jgi:SNF2 family DNA or RNA helicase